MPGVLLGVPGWDRCVVPRHHALLCLPEKNLYLLPMRFVSPQKRQQRLCDGRVSRPLLMDSHRQRSEFPRVKSNENVTEMSASFLWVSGVGFVVVNEL